MALKQPFAIKTQLGNTDLELEAGPGESLLVKDIMVHDCDESYCTIRVDKTTVGYFRTGGRCGAHIHRLAAWNRHSHGITLNLDQAVGGASDYRVRNLIGSDLNLLMPAAPDGDPESGSYRWNEAVQRVNGPRLETLMQYLTKKGLWKGFPIAEGETMKITGVAKSEAYSKQVVIYEVHEAGDITPDMENGSKSPTYVFLNYGNCGTAITAIGDKLYTTSISPAEFPSFPLGAVVPAKHKIEVLGICASPFAPKENLTLTHIYTQFMKLVRDREVLFDEDRQGILFENKQLDLFGREDSIAQGFSLIGNKSEHDPQDPFMFDPPLVFLAGDELGIYVTSVKVGAGSEEIDIEEHEICLIERVTRLE